MSQTEKTNEQNKMADSLAIPRNSIHVYRVRSRSQAPVDFAAIVELAKKKRIAEGERLTILTSQNTGTIRRPSVGQTLVEKMLGQAKLAYVRMGMEHMGLVLVVILYAFIGAALFTWIEGPAEKTARATSERARESANLSLQWALGNYTNAGCTSSSLVELRSAINSYAQQLKMNEPIEKTSWDYWGSMFYAGTLFTTIGYGHYAPRTKLGKIMTMLYALLGIPLVLATLNDLGVIMTRTLKKPWTRLMNKSRRIWYHCILNSRSSTVNPDKKDTQEHFEDREFNFSVPVALIMLAVWICISSAFVLIWEREWDYFQSFYFFFISLTTIGLGDVVPDHPRYMILAFPLVFAGLALISMVITILQTKISGVREQGFDIIEETLGWEMDSDSDDEPKPPADANTKGSETPRHSLRKASNSRGASMGIFQAMRSNSRMKSATNSSERLEPTTALHMWVDKAVRKRRRGVQTDESMFDDQKKAPPPIILEKYHLILPSPSRKPKGIITEPKQSPRF